MGIEEISILIRNLQETLEKVDSRLSDLKRALRDLSKDRQKLVKKLDRLKSNYKKIKNGDSLVHITDHAVIRFLERVNGLDMNEVKKFILPDGGLELLKAMGYKNGVYTMGSHNIVFEDFTIITVHK